MAALSQIRRQRRSGGENGRTGRSAPSLRFAELTHVSERRLAIGDKQA
jgi:hypothetical protein